MAKRSLEQTQSDKTGQVGELSVQQLNAIDLFMAGLRDAEVAESVGMTRQTVNGWRNQDPEFRAALNTRRGEVIDQSRDRLRSTVALASEIVAEELERERDPKLALTILKLAASGTLQLAEIGPKTATGVKLEDRQRHEEEMLSLLVLSAREFDAS